MDTTDTEIVFDHNGNCNHCNDFFKNRANQTYEGEKSDKELELILNKIKKYSKRRKYDCLIGISGGVDSCFVTYMAARWGLRPLIVHFDNGWDSELAARNIELIIKKLGFDYQTYVVDWEEFRDVQLSFLKASVLDMETPTDHAFLAALYKISLDFGIKYILTGSNFATESILPKSWGYNSKDLRQLKAIYNRFGSGNIITFPMLGFWKEFYYTYVRGIKLVRVLSYVPYNKKDAIKILHNEFNWQYYGGKHYESLFTKFSQAYILPKKFNVDKRRAHLSSQICNGEMTRSEALEILKDEAYSQTDIDRDTDFVCLKLGITKEEFNSILSLPVKSYKDYPNNEKFLSVIYSIYNSLRKR